MFDIEKRLEKLEKSNRKMKSIAIVATLACVGFMTIAATPRGGGDGWFENLFVMDTLKIEPGGSQQIDGGTLNLDYGHLHLNDSSQTINGGGLSVSDGALDLYSSNQNIYNGGLDIDAGYLDLYYGDLGLYGSSQYILNGSLYIDYGNLNLHNTDQYIHSGNLSIDSGTLNIHYGSLNIDGGDLNVTNGAIHIDGENLSHVLEDLQVQINSLQEELMECCGAVATCPSDLNDDENVNVHDLLQLISEWGACS